MNVRPHLCSAIVALGIASFASSTNAKYITKVTESGTALSTAKIQVETATFGEDAWIFTNRTHEFNGAAFDATTKLPSTTGTLVIGLPSYLIGGEYIATANDNRTVADYQMKVTVATSVDMFLLLDNRRGDANSANPPALSATVMPWVTADGWQIMKTGVSPLLPDGSMQPDYGGYDEGVRADPPAPRTHGTASLGIGPGKDLNQFFSIYHKIVGPGEITLGAYGESNNMYSVVVTPEPASVALLGLGALGLLARRSRR